MKLKIIFLSLFLISGALFAQDNNTNSKGYYKDVFMDSGIKLTSMTDLCAARYLGLSIETFYSAAGNEKDPLTLADTLMQAFMMVGSEQDQNGMLLYPDGAPRFRMIYVNGGKASSHGKSLGKAGKQRFQDYVANGGSYLGTCAGAFLSSLGTSTDTILPRQDYFNLWDGVTFHTKLYDTYTGMFIEKNSPLLKYYDFGGDMYIDSLWHWGGCYIYEEYAYPKETEILLRYDYKPLVNGKKMHRKISSWAYKANDTTGRVVVIGSHPEKACSGERLDLMAALMRYAMDGNGCPKIKCELQSGVPVEMSKMTYDNDPAHARIGDRQYHHFKITVPEETKELKIDLSAVNDCPQHNLSLFVKKGEFAFNDNACYKNVDLGIDKTMTIENPEAGEYYISVLGEDTVTTRNSDYGTAYTSNLEVLNGIAYKIEVSLK